MSSEPLDDLRSDASAGGTSRVGSWILFLLHPKVAIPLLLILSLISAPLVYRAIRLSRVPPADEPFDTKSVLEFVVPDADNAFVEYRAASVLRVEYAGTPGDPQRSQDEFEKAQSDGWVYATEPVLKWLDANRPFMELWRKGTTKPDAQYCRASELRADTSLLSVQETREFSRLVRLEASRLLAEGQPEEAWDWLRTSFRMSRQLGRHGPWIERLVGAATHSLTAEGMVKWANDPQVTAELLRRTMRELPDEQKRTPPLSACLQTEYLSVMATWKSMAIGPADPTLNRLTGESELNERIFRHVFANWLGQADLPRNQRTKTLPGLFVFEPSPENVKAQPSASELSGYIHESVMAAMLVSSGQGIFTATDREAARDTVLLTVLALELFSREHGHYPEKLDELVPDFLPAVPDDNHAPPKTALRYQRDANGALIYSVGDNGTDDGGLFKEAEDIGYRIGKPRE
ncbi:MAG: hypothetical protein IAG10_33910 [Planctomycetaceae bacterium]|nr:hypothetical protein [Planctomycetaceae bacterium]